MPNDIQDWTAAVNVQAGTVTIGSGSVSISGIPTVNINVGQSVAISGIASVAISGTPTVQFAAGQAVSINGTPSVTIASGTVSIGGTPNINISGQSITVNTNQPQTLVLDTDLGPNVASVSAFTALLPTGTHAIEVYWSAGTVPLSRVATWNAQGGATSNFYRQFAAAPNTLPYPFKISGLIETNGLKINATFAPALGAGETVHVKVVAVLDTAIPVITDQATYSNLDPLQVDVTSRAGRLAGHVTVDSFGAQIDVSDRTARQLGQVQTFPPQSVTSAPYSTSLAAGASVTLIGGVAGTRIYCLAWNLYVLTAAGCELTIQDGAGTILARDRGDTTGFRPHALAGAGGGTGQGVVLQNHAGAGGVVVTGELVALQQ